MSIVHISGRIGRDAEVRSVGDNNVANFSVAENIGFGDKKATQWWSCALWGSRGEKLAQYLTKGSAVTVCGEVTVREYDGKDGTRKWELQCRVMDVALQGSRENGDERPARESVDTSARRDTSNGRPSSTAPAADPGFDDDIPF